MGNESVTKEEVAKIASLSKLHLEGSELEALTHDFNEILAFVGQIGEVDTANVEPISHVLDLNDVTRTDEPGSSFSTDEIKSIAPNFSAGYFVVPQVIESEA